MKRHSKILMTAVFVMGMAIGACAAKVAVEPTLYMGKDKKAAGESLLKLAESLDRGSWEMIRVGRGYYLGGNKTEGQRIFDSVTKSPKVTGGDWLRIGRVYFEADEWEKAKAAFETALRMEPNDAPWMAEVGAYYNVKGDRARAEELFKKSFAIETDHGSTVHMGASYLGVAPR